MPNPIQAKKILLGVTGSIACYKAADLASKLRQAGADVDVILTAAAEEFITPLTFQSVTGRRAFRDADLWGDAGHVLHVGLAEIADLMVIAPATANTIAKLAHGLAPDLLSVAALAARCPILVAPAMDGGMWQHPATQANVATLLGRGVHILGPASGHLASGLSGAGRMMEPMDIQAEIRRMLAADGPLSGRHIVVTAGGTWEPIDPVRMLTNRSSGKQGFAQAQAALDQGASVTLIHAPVHLPAPAGAQQVPIESSQEMLEAVLHALPEADALVMAAAVADFRPAERASHKIKKSSAALQIELIPNPDILRSVAEQRSQIGFDGVAIGFAAESQDLIENARKKMEAKNLDLIVANDISAPNAGFQVDTNRVTLIFRDGRLETLPLMDKERVAERIMQEVVHLLA